MTDCTTQIAIGVVEHQGRFLVGRRQPSQPLAGLHEFPGGKIQAGETPDAAVERECLEETGIAVEALQIISSHMHQYEHGAVRLHFFACRPLDSSQAPRFPFRWLTREQLRGCEFPAGNRAVLAGLTRPPEETV